MVWAVGNRVGAQRSDRAAAQKESVGSEQVLEHHEEVKWRNEGKR